MTASFTLWSYGYLHRVHIVEMLYDIIEPGTEPIPPPQNDILVANAHELRC